MGFIKDGETKVFVSKKDQNKTAAPEEQVRYTVDDLIKDQEKSKKETQSEEE